MEKYDVVIIGGGPAGLTASLYTSRVNLSTLFIDKGAPGGKMVKTSTIENWIGDELVTGPQLSLRMYNHARHFGAKHKFGEVVDVISNGKEDKIITLASGEKIQARSIIIATGMLERIPKDIIGIQKYENFGVSYCAICDGPLYKNKNVAVIGGGMSAVEESIYLSQFVNNVKMFVRKDFRVHQKHIDELLSKKNIEVFKNSEIKEILGEKKVEKIIANVDGKDQEFYVEAIFPYIGQEPMTHFLKNLNLEYDNGFIITNDDMETNVENVFAIGDIRKKNIRQISTAVADGTIVGKILVNLL